MARAHGSSLYGDLWYMGPRLREDDKTSRPRKGQVGRHEGVMVGGAQNSRQGRDAMEPDLPLDPKQMPFYHRPILPVPGVLARRGFLHGNR